MWITPPPAGAAQDQKADPTPVASDPGDDDAPRFNDRVRAGGWSPAEIAHLGLPEVGSAVMWPTPKMENELEGYGSEGSADTEDDWYDEDHLNSTLDD